MTYTADFNGTDLGPIIVDLLGTVVVAFVPFGTPLALLFLYRWLKGKNIM